MRRIKVSYQTVTPESAEYGECFDRGWINKEGICIDPEEHDDYDGTNESDVAVDLAVKAILDDSGSVKASDYPKCSPGNTRYTQIDADKDYNDGSETTHSYHLDGFSIEEELAIYAELTGQ